MTTAERQPSKPYPTRAHYPPVEPVICPKGPVLYRTRRAGHYYQRNDKGIWTCRNCQAVRP